jgi:hypothetical protein
MDNQMRRMVQERLTLIFGFALNDASGKNNIAQKTSSCPLAGRKRQHGCRLGLAAPFAIKLGDRCIVSKDYRQIALR